METRVIYRHPMGRFEVRERTGRTMMGGTYCIREAVLTPGRDVRGLLHDSDLRDLPPITRRGNGPVTDEERERIAMMYKERMHPRYIAIQTERSVDTIYRELEAMGLRRRPRKNARWTETELTRGYRMYLNGMSYAQIAVELGRSKGAVYQALSQMRGV